VRWQSSSLKVVDSCAVGVLEETEKTCFLKEETNLSQIGQAHFSQNMYVTVNKLINYS
jgi:hypothetical protein